MEMKLNRTSDFVEGTSSWKCKHKQKVITRSATYYISSCFDAFVCKHPSHHFMNIYTLILKVATIFLFIFLHFS